MPSGELPRLPTPDRPLRLEGRLGSTWLTKLFQSAGRPGRREDRAASSGVSVTGEMVWRTAPDIDPAVAAAGSTQRESFNRSSRLTMFRVRRTAARRRCVGH